jgi:hypothetical protein
MHARRLFRSTGMNTQSPRTWWPWFLAVGNTLWFWTQPGFGADARQFLTVAKWRGAFTQTLFVEGSESNPKGCAVTAHWRHDFSVSTTLNVLLTSPSGAAWSADFFESVGGTNAPFTGHVVVDEYLQAVCPDGTTTAQVQNGRLQGSFGLQILTLPSPTYTVSFPGVMVDGYINGSFASSYVEDWVAGTGVTSPLPAGTNLVLEGSTNIAVNSQDVTLEFLVGDPTTLLNGVTKTVTWHLEPAADLELVVDIPGYDSWIPAADLKNAALGYEGNTLAVTATLQQTDGTPTAVKADKFHFELVSDSQQPGVCMNFPSKDAANTDPDLQFNLHKNDTAKFTASDSGRVIETLPTTAGSTATAVLSAYDFGAYAVLRVTAYVGGQPIVGYLKSDPSRKTTDIRLPKRASDSFIADAWKQQMGVTGAKDDDDLDDAPTGDNDKGDGLTLYEEYRGFSENRTHRRTNPHHKDLFIRDEISSSRSMSGITLWRRLSQLDVHARLAADEITFFTRVINFNIDGSTPHKVDQHVLILASRDEGGVSKAVPSGPAYTGMNSTPASKSVIGILPDIDYFTAVAVGRGKIMTDEFASTVAHELAHGCSVYHHGDLDQHPTWAFDSLDVANGGALYQESGSSSPGLIFVLNEAGSRLAPFPGGTSVVVWIGMPKGQHSGMEDCIMRYDCAQAYDSTPQPGGRYWIEGDELTGLFLCTSQNGTGVNAPGRSPQPRYGPTADRRGNCAGAICVNDTYVDDAKHHR